jgi:hypothetical protein
MANANLAEGGKKMNLGKLLIDDWNKTRKQKALADCIGVSEQKLSRWKTGTVPIPIDQFFCLAKCVVGEELGQVLLWQFVAERVERRRNPQSELKLETLDEFFGSRPDGRVPGEHRR